MAPAVGPDNLRVFQPDLRLFGAIITALALVLGGCGSEDELPVQQSSTMPRAKVDVRNRSVAVSELPSGCSLPEVRAIFKDMLSGANARDRSRQGYQRFLDNAKVEPVTPGNGHRSGPFRRPTSGPATDDPVVAVGFGVTVTAKDRPDIYLAGKGGINCETGRFYMYSGG